MSFVTQVIVPVLSVFATAIATALVAYFSKRSKAAEKQLEEERSQGTRKIIQDELGPVIEEIHRLQKRIKELEDSNDTHWGLIVEQYKFRLIQICKAYLHQGFMTPDEYEQLNEFYRVYVGLGGNGQAQEYFARTARLEIKEIPEE